MYCTMNSGGLDGIVAYCVRVEVDVSTGLPGFQLVGSLSGEVREARERVMVALKNAGFDFPPMKITVNLAPANTRKEGTGYDLAIAVGILSAFGYFEAEELSSYLFVGELGLNGELRPVRGIFPIVRAAAEKGLTCAVVPAQNGTEGALAAGLEVRGAETIGQVVKFLQHSKGSKGSEDSNRRDEILPVVSPPGMEARKLAVTEDFSEVRGQEAAKRAAEIGAAGFHNLAMIGPPGTGKSMIAKRIPGILPPLETEECMEVSAIYSVAGLLKEEQPLIQSRPFQSPHHTVTMTALTGGSSMPRPGVMSLAHRGILFLDELPEFSRSVLDCMRQPLEEKKVQVARVHGNMTFPADFMLVCAMNPCLCGYYPDRNRCRCSETAIRKYLGRISGPLLDRIDLGVEILPVSLKHLRQEAGESSERIRKRVTEARNRQKERFAGSNYRFNSELSAADTEKYCELKPGEQRLMERAFDAIGLSARGYHRILRVARTIADLAGEEQIREAHLLEALGYRFRIFGEREE